MTEALHLKKHSFASLSLWCVPTLHLALVWTVYFKILLACPNVHLHYITYEYVTAECRNILCQPQSEGKFFPVLN